MLGGDLVIFSKWARLTPCQIGRYIIALDKGHFIWWLAAVQGEADA